MRLRLLVAAIVAAMAACALSLGITSVAMAGNGHGNGNGQAPAAAPQGGGSNSTATSGPGTSSQGCDGSHNSDSGHGANHTGPYDNTCDGSPSGNGNGNGHARGKPCAGCVGNADDKNPKGQYPNGSDHNAGYECDRNHGIGRSNPAHTGCKGTETPPPPPPGCGKPKGCDHGGAGGCGKPEGCDHGGGSGCDKPEGCDHGGGGCGKPTSCDQGGGNGCGKSEGCDHGGSVETPSTKATETDQAVLGVSTSGRSPGSSPSKSTATKPTPSRRVLGVTESGGTTSPSGSNAAPAAATTPPAAAVAARSSRGSLPFTGTDVIVLILAGLFVLLVGLVMRRMLVRDAP